MEDFSKYKDLFINLVVEYGTQIVGALVVLIIGMRVIKAIGKSVSKMMAKREVDASLQPFLRSLITSLLRVMLIISVLGILKVEVTSFIAILGAAGLAVGMALSGTLQNFAGGVIILILKPFKVGDVIEAQGYTGSVKEIQIFSTIMNTPDNKVIIIPNGPLSTGALVNYSREATRRVDFVFGIGYNDDIDQARAVLQELINADERALKDPEPLIVVSELADSSVNFTVRVWVEAKDYWGFFFHMQESVKKTFDSKGISIPYPQRDIHMHQASS